MLFALYCRDRENAAEVRLATRAAHLEYAGQSSQIRMAGPMLSDDGEGMIGSLFVIEADDIAAARAFNAADPYTTAGLWAEVRIHPFRWLLPEPRE